MWLLAYDCSRWEGRWWAPIRYAPPSALLVVLLLLMLAQA